MHPERVYHRRVATAKVTATVELWNDDEGWGALAESDAMPGGAFVSFGAIVGKGYISLRAGQKVDAEIEGPLSFDQDGYRYIAVAVWPPQRTRRSLICIFANEPNGCG